MPKCSAYAESGRGLNDRVLRVSFADVLESPAELPPPTDTPTP